MVTLNCFSLGWHKFLVIETNGGVVFRNMVTTGMNKCKYVLTPPPPPRLPDVRSGYIGKEVQIFRVKDHEVPGT